MELEASVGEVTAWYLDQIRDPAPLPTRAGIGIGADAA